VSPLEVVGMSDASRTQLEHGKRAPRDSWQPAAAAVPDRYQPAI
jgi:hypothetical protein